MVHLPAATLVGRFYPEWNREYPVRAPVMSIGSASENTLRIPDPRISPCQVRVLRVDGGYQLEVVGDRSVTSLNGGSLAPGERRPLTHGDLFALAGLAFEFTLDHAVKVLSRLSVLEGVHQGKRFRIDRQQALIGRGADNDVQFPDRSVSRRHCRIAWQDSAWWLEDLVSRNGTLLNGAPIREPVVLRDGDEVRAGRSRFVFSEGVVV